MSERPRGQVRPGDRIGGHVILEVLGEGGMGTVYLAEQKEPIRRRVAVKVIKLGMDSEAVLQRFELERQALALMSHDAIARVFDAGMTERGQPYLVMEYAPGLPLVEYCDRHKLSLEERCRLFQNICAGVQHAHQKGVIHRDLKPSNVLVTEEQGEPKPKIIDFGLACATDHILLRETMHTQPGQLLGTPNYMSPEQADPTVQDVDTRTDIYSLGVTLYELLVGELPFAELRGVGLLERQRRICDTDPLRPSAKLSSIGGASSQSAAARGMTASSLYRALRSDLDWVVLKALDRDRNRRYESAAGLQMDVGRFLAHEPVVAKPPSAGYRLKKLVRRNRVQVTAGALVFLALIAGVIGTSVGLQREQRQRAIADETARRLQERTNEFEILSLVVHLDETRRKELDLYPAWPENAGRMEAWLRDDVGRLRDGLPRARETVQALRDRAIGAPSADPGDGAEVWSFEHEADRFLHDTLSAQSTEIENFLDTDVAEVARRLHWAEHVEHLTIGRFRARWDEARAALARADDVLASSLYAAHPVDLAPQMGLIPIGMNPHTLLWEFYHLRSACDPEWDTDPGDAPIPEHDSDGWIDVAEATGVVFVLVPGGTFTMGAQSTDPEAPNHDPRAADNEAPAHTMTLAPFFLARHELTQGQWLRLSGEDNPSYYEPGELGVNLSHPVEEIDWTSSDELMRHHGLLLPTEAQWEYGCRAGTATAWWTGEDRESLILDGLAANLADQAAARAGVKWASIKDWPELDDGFAAHAPVDAMRPNPWGLHLVHGNLWEWCSDRRAPYESEAAPGDGLRDAPGVAARVNRGGSFHSDTRYARSSFRSSLAASTRSSTLGMRAARRLAP